MKKIYLLISLIFFCYAQTLNAQPITLDPTFGQNGLAVFSSGLITHFEFDKYDNIIAAGSCEMWLNGWYDFPVLLKTDPNGNLDQTFGTDGMVILSDDFTEDWEIYGLKITADNKILLIISSFPYISWKLNDGTWMIQFNEDGSLDHSYGNNGKVFLNPILSIDLTNDDYFITVSGDAESEFLLKQNYKGEIDTTFGNNGKVYMTDHKTFLIYPECVKILNDNSIIVAGCDHFTQAPLGHYINLAFFKLTPNGQFDTNFTGNGVVIIESGDVFGKSFYNVIGDTNGSLVFIGSKHADNGNNNKFISRFTSNGTVDSSFGENGFLYYTEIHTDAYEKSLLQNGDKYLIGEIRTIYSFNNNGTVDSSFNNSGRFWLGDIDFFHAMKLRNNKVTVGGMKFNGYDYPMVMARINLLPDHSIQPHGFTDHRLIIFPNPAKDYLNFNAEQQFEIMDIQGRVLLKNKQATQSVDVSFLKAGIYFIRFEGSNRMMKFIKQ